MNKKMVSALYVTVFAVAALLAATPAFATNGYFAHGYGVNDQAMGGAGVALPQDSLDAAVNPANMVFVGGQYEFGLGYFNPNRQYTVSGTPTGSPPTAFPLMPGTVKSSNNWFIIPSLSANWMLNDKSSFGVSVYGNGGMNTDYKASTFGGFSPTGVDLSQLFVAPTYARKIADHHALGISPILAYQSFEARGLQAFGQLGFSSDPNNLTNNQHDKAYGYGARIGYQGEIVPDILNLGVSYQTKIDMSKFHKYSGLFAQQGSFDVPSNWTVGLAVKALPVLTVAFDVQRINYSDVKAVHNPLLPNLNTMISHSQLGNDGGAGFGWKNMTIYKLGLQWKSGGGWTWRAGYSKGNQPIPDSEVLFNILAPGVIEQHATVGFTKAVSEKQDLNVAVTRAFSHSVTGPNPLDPTEYITLKMDQWQVAASYAWKF